MYSDPMRFADLAPVVGGEPTRELVRQAKAAGTLIERRPHAEPGVSSRRRAHFQTVAAAQSLPLQHASGSNTDCAGLSEPAVMLVRGEHVEPGPYEAFVEQTLGQIFAAFSVNPSELHCGLIRIGPGDI